ncbi:AMP-binding protein [Streptosporangiaceae bacterium NEAU-GS5]|nr:AMP-binding protein [Streptosporangiaceae bacterium NEAU-GS5]
MTTYVDLLLDALRDGGDHEVLVDHDRRVSAAEAHDTVLRLANALRGHGVGKGDAVAVITGNTSDGILVWFALHLLGARLILTPFDEAAGERGTFLRRAGTDVIVYDETGAELAPEGGARLLLTVDDLLRRAATCPATRPDGCAGRDDVSTVFHTGGTTGRPKMVLHGHPYYDVMVFGADRRYFTFPPPNRFLVMTPLTHTSGQICVVVTLLSGGTVVLLDSFEPGAFIDTVRRERVSAVMLVPAMLYELLDHPDMPADGLGLARVNYGGAPASPVRLREALRRFGPVLRQTYALTEVPTIAVLPPEEHDESAPGRLASCGKPIPLVEVVLRDDGRDVAPGEVGEVCVRGSIVMTEYWKDPELTAETVRDGWFHTGDLGTFDEDGYLHLVGRRSDTIITGRRELGVYLTHIYPRLLEDVLNAVPGVRSCAAVGAPDEAYGEAAHVFVVPGPDLSADPADLRKRVVEELGPVYEPRTITYVEGLPYTPFGKVDRKALRRMIESA